MKTVTIQELQSNAQELIDNVLNNDEFFEIQTESGTAVVINELEWNILVESLRHSMKE